MILLKIFDIKITMAELLMQESYDLFYLEEAKVNTFVKMQLSGFRNMRYYSEEEKEGLSEYILLKEVRPYLFSFIKGKKIPDSFQISLRPPDRFREEVLGKAAELGSVDYYLHFRFENEELSVVTGCFYHEFTMDKEAEYTWDKAVKDFFRQKGISYEEQ